MAAAVPPSDVAPTTRVDGRVFRISREDELERVARELGPPAPVLVVVGGADGMDDDELAVAEHVVPALVGVAEARGAAVVDGGTDAGVMRVVGRARGAASFPLVGVVAEGVVAEAALEPNHTHFLLVPGSSWGDESRWLCALAGEIGGARPSATVVVNGGEIALADVELSIGAGRPVVAVAGTGRAADAIAAAVGGAPPADRIADAAASGLVRVADAADPQSLRTVLDEILGAG